MGNILLQTDLDDRLKKASDFLESLSVASRSSNGDISDFRSPRQDVSVKKGIINPPMRKKVTEEQLIKEFLEYFE